MIKRYEYKHIENVNSLRLPVNFAKLKGVKDVEEAYYILSTKDKKKAAYVLEALESYNEEDSVVSKAFQRFRIANKTREIFEIVSDEDAKKLLSTPKTSPEYIAITKLIPPKTEPAKALLGFKIDDEKSKRVHKELYDLSATKRVLKISKAVVNHVLEGRDPEMEKVFAIRFALSAIDEYQNSENKAATLNNFLTAIRF